jgi:hypothetical protein
VATTGPTPNRTVRIADDLWLPAKQIAAEHGEMVTDVISRSLEQYVSTRGYGVDPVTALERLAALHAAGLIPDDEWGPKRRELLDRV